MYKEPSNTISSTNIALDLNTIADKEFDIIPSYKLPPEDVVHLWYRREPGGY